MNWQNIKDKCPKAWDEFCSWARVEYCEFRSVMKNPEVYSADCLIVYDEVFDPRDLYDFFDGKGIHGFLHPEWVTDYSVAPEKVTMFFGYSINGQPGRPSGFYSEPLPKNRAEAEDELFTKEFEILEQQLTSNKEK